ncbi:XRE family transcriptional regulator [Kitasatospora sp. NPDC051853]|uniref:XRE family transcriptional regulator n=1 Tax=Kitasatospora sp. NPDC051853 TaxID=3364058 RepID=UPI0037B5E0BA
MGRPERPVDASGGAVAEFAGRLRRLRAEAGSPTYRDMARTAMYSASVLSSAANGHRLPTLQVALAYVAACGGEREEWRRRWLDAAARGGVPVIGSRPAAPADAAQEASGVSELTSWMNGRESGQERAGGTGPSSDGGTGVGTDSREGADAGPYVLPTAPDFAAPPGGPSVPVQLPLRPHGLVGREAELGRLGGPGGSPVVISGPVGVGKSGLALRHAHDLAPSMVDGQLYADLGPLAEQDYDLSGLLGSFLAALGVEPGRIPATADQRAALYRSLIARRRVLVLLENVHCERQVRPLLTDSATSTTLVVSRSALLGLRDVRRLRLDPLDRAESLRLIAAVLPERAGADPAAADRLAELCGDLPLALDIATRKLLPRPELPLRWAVARLAEPAALLDWLSVGDLSMRESLNSAHLALGAAAAGLLDRLARIPVRELWAQEPLLAEHEEPVQELVEAGVLRHGARPGGYRLDPLVRAFVLDRDPAHNLLPRRTRPFPQIRPASG